MSEHGICLILKYVDRLGMGIIKQQDDTVSFSNGATAQGRLLSSLYILASLHLPPLHLPNAVWVCLWGAFLLAH